MELIEALRTTGAVRDFSDRPVADEVIHTVLDAARFAPSGGNRQAWRAVVVRDPAVKERIRDLYLSAWYDYLAIGRAGLVPWAPITDREAEAAALTSAGELREAARVSPGGGGFAEHLDRVPAMLVVLADLTALAAIDRDHDRYSLIGGGSVYPFAWSVLLAAREHGLGGVLTTMLARQEAAVADLLGFDDRFALAALLALGYPAGPPPTRLKRAAVEDFVTVDRFDGPAFTVSG